MASNMPKQSDLNLASRDIIDLADGYRAVSFPSILRTGKVDATISSNTAIPDHYIDWSQKDAFVQTIIDLQENVVARISQDPKMAALLNDPHWDMNDRMSWEERLSEITSEEMDKIPAYSYYRTVGLPGAAAAQSRATRVNDLSADINNNTKNLEFDCETMSIVEGVIMQSVEHAYIGQQKPTVDNLKGEGTYFYSGGAVYYGPSTGGFGGHAFIMSSLTGSIIEATADPSNQQASYRRTDSTFAEFVSGKTVTTDGKNTNDTAVYGAFSREGNQATSNKFAAYYKQGQQAEFVAAINAMDNVTITDIRNAAPNAQLYPSEVSFFQAQYQGKLNSLELKMGDSMVFESPSDNRNILVTSSPQGALEFKDVTGLNITGLPKITYTNNLNPPPVQPYQAPQYGNATTPSTLPTSYAAPFRAAIANNAAFDPRVQELQNALAQNNPLYQQQMSNAQGVYADGMEGGKTRAVINDFAQKNGLNPNAMSIEDFTRAVEHQNLQQNASINSQQAQSYAIAAAEMGASTLPNLFENAHNGDVQNAQPMAIPNFFPNL